ncbi:S-adenosyl-L-methionine-dependent methyltransferase [Aspergillus coremiiformis]|uniref:catechol O-methyltransferase n=1 Tax=Aspergillus coremiiformis TaxID=138285 RepID=A0A5N6ZHA6_9EURO|nr:S-adenosyl-L-methionine-dependent methyltransferase [Aspergillus coremiiformis]
MAQTQSTTRQREDEAELGVLDFIYAQPNRDEIQGNPRKVLDLIDEYAKSHRLIHVGPEKGKIVTDLIAERKPQTMIELGGYIGYSAILFADALRRAGGKKYYSLELNPECAAIASLLIDLAGLRDFVQILVDRSDLSLNKLYTTGEVKQVEVLFIDHYKPAYTADLKLCEQLGMIVPDVSVLVADNMIYPGNPPYLEYVRSTVEQKRKAAEKGPTRIFTKDGIPGSNVRNFLGETSVPLFDLLGNPNLVYESTFNQPEGLQDAIEITRCVGIEKQ